MQTTLKGETTLVGMGLHSGRPARLRLRPASEGGIRFHRVDVTDRDNVIPARFDLVSDTRLCTVLSNAAGVSVSTVEHLMAALAGTGVTHAIVEIDGPEVPIMDGSSLRFVQAILRAGLRGLGGPQRAIRVLAPVRVVEGDARAELAPAQTLSIDFEIDFPDAAIGRQSRAMAMVNGAFVHELSDCRTFCRRVEVEAMRASGLALGGSLDNAVVVEGDRVLNPGGFRRVDECVRHKMLDAVGDLALAGAPILGAYRGVRAGHGLTNRLLRRLFATEGAWEEVVIDAATARRLPGAGLGMADLRRAG
ncbi:MAG TPA: UDP-3-O-acyl-N-acetylglucosamine deacetylase [Amaricoccus sp.]|uniref:UDP-3-O-acyl-N-acetylglucosamine deacetylase n=1 Tax=Amaricoccus sp. TaxID=1872485 RepID=UPI001DCEA2FE|nr:UDP-3-O-acyl-N-acetylglucosamine deacetylase [Amaricoccus sp.]MCB1375803.1 UDP-3-O-acyl-N-acetylglucosamine deacetylase [Paracoccaceae bacterium]MCC0067638.1 UDP-3-O-acyl-N-acetylglucosamine deacetylase [Rhodovulum sp.]HPG21629.1 UDP-3-O-acyl-N-acetylglucosamine deacetylase [Amaricoccus sp.]HRW15883.1 UDP-3-O-acyl-N-acetylglucosamine deacetylase [Amaricoccus sp.]